MIEQPSCGSMQHGAHLAIQRRPATWRAVGDEPPGTCAQRARRECVHREPPMISRGAGEVPHHGPCSRARVDLDPGLRLGHRPQERPLLRHHALGDLRVHVRVEVVVRAERMGWLSRIDARIASARLRLDDASAATSPAQHDGRRTWTNPVLDGPSRQAASPNRRRCRRSCGALAGRAAPGRQPRGCSRRSRRRSAERRVP